MEFCVFQLRYINQPVSWSNPIYIYIHQPIFYMNQFKEHLYDPISYTSNPHIHPRNPIKSHQLSSPNPWEGAKALGAGLQNCPFLQDAWTGLLLFRPLELVPTFSHGSQLFVEVPGLAGKSGEPSCCWAWTVQTLIITWNNCVCVVGLGFKKMFQMGWFVKRYIFQQGFLDDFCWDPFDVQKQPLLILWESCSHFSVFSDSKGIESSKESLG